MKLTKMLHVAMFSLALPAAALAQSNPSDTGTQGQQPQQGTDTTRQGSSDTGKMNEPAPGDKSNTDINKTNPDVNKNEPEMNKSKKQQQGTPQPY